MAKHHTIEVSISLEDVASVYFQVVCDELENSPAPSKSWKRSGAGTLMTLDRRCYQFTDHAIVGSDIVLKVPTNEL